MALLILLVFFGQRSLSLSFIICKMGVLDQMISKGSFSQVAGFCDSIGESQEYIYLRDLGEEAGKSQSLRAALLSSSSSIREPIL